MGLKIDAHGLRSTIELLDAIRAVQPVGGDLALATAAIIAAVEALGRSGLAAPAVGQLLRDVGGRVERGEELFETATEPVRRLNTLRPAVLSINGAVRASAAAGTPEHELTAALISELVNSFGRRGMGSAAVAENFRRLGAHIERNPQVMGFVSALPS